jgi:hypothetical protein
MMILAALAGMAMAPEQCRTVYGRIYVANGSPAIRIWVVETRRVLGVGTQDDLSLDDLPANLRRLWLRRSPSLFDASIYGDFRVCAREPQRSGRMQMVRVVRASRLVAGESR